MGNWVMEPLAALDLAGPFIDGRQIAVQIPGVALAAGHLTLGTGHFPQGLAVVGHVREDGQDVVVPVEGQVLRHGQGQAGGDEPLDGRVVRQVEEHDHVVEHAAGFEGLAEEVGHVVLHPHGRKDDGEALLFPREPGLAHDLGRQFVVRQAAHGEDGELLPPDQGVHAIDGRDPRLDELLGIGPGRGIDGLAVDVAAGLAHRQRAAVQGLAHAVEDPPQKICRHRHRQRAAGKTHPSFLQGQAHGFAEKLDHRLVPTHGQDPAGLAGAVRDGDFDTFVKTHPLDARNHQERPGDGLEAQVFPAGEIGFRFSVFGFRLIIHGFSVAISCQQTLRIGAGDLPVGCGTAHHVHFFLVPNGSVLGNQNENSVDSLHSL